MAIKKITRKVISKAQDQETTTETEQEVQPAPRVKRTCFFCQSKTSPQFTDLQTLRRFLSDRSKIVPKLKSNLCSRHQRAVSRQIKYARFLSLLPFTPKV